MGTVGLGWLTGCRRTRTRDEVLVALVRGPVLEDTRAIAVTSAALAESTARLAAAPSPKGVEDARTAWRACAVRWKRGLCFRHGPLVESAALFRCAFWPPRPKAIDALVSDAEPLTDARIDDLGVDAKGLYAVEYLLFGASKPDAGSVAALLAPEAERRRRAIAALAHSIRRWADQATNALGDGSATATQVSLGGQETVNGLVNQMASTVESVVKRVTQVSELAASAHLSPSEVEGWPSGISTELARSLVSGTELLYLGTPDGGLGDLVTAAAPAIDLRVRSAFAAVRDGLAAVGAPLEEAITSRRAAVDSAGTALKALELALKTDLASALGVTLTFTTGDGD